MSRDVLWTIELVLPIYTLYSPEVESRTQGSKPRTQKKSEAKAKDSLSEDRHSRGQGQECSRPRPRTKDTSASALQKKVFTKIFQAFSTKKRFPKNFSTAPRYFDNSKNSAVLEPKTGQFSRTWGLEAKAKNLTFEAKAKDFEICPRGLHLWYSHWVNCLSLSFNSPTPLSSWSPCPFYLFNFSSLSISPLGPLSRVKFFFCSVLPWSQLRLCFTILFWF